MGITALGIDQDLLYLVGSWFFLNLDSFIRLRSTFKAPQLASLHFLD